MSYFQTKSDLKAVLDFRDAVVVLWKIESEAAAQLRHHDFMTPDDRRRAILRESAKVENYQEIRAKVARGTLRASRLARRLGVPIRLQSFPPLAIGGPVIDVDLFQAVLHDNSYGGIDRQLIYDALNQLTGELEAKTAKEFRQLVNPIYWVRELLVLIVRIPFIIIEASGFDVHKIEDHLFGKLFKVLEIAALIYILIRIGLTPEQLRDVMSRFMP
jgi:hypothetical protein